MTNPNWRSPLHNCETAGCLQDEHMPDVVSIAPDDPRYCSDPDLNHPAHDFRYEYTNVEGEQVKGVYYCQRTNRVLR